jgi:hypothetical protein
VAATIHRAGSGASYRASHTLHIEDRLEDARDVLGLAKGYFEQFGALANDLARRDMNRGDMTDAVDAIFKVEDMAYTKIPKTTAAAMSEVHRLSEEGVGNETFAGTAWGLYNGVTEYLDHHAPMRANNNQAARRLDDLWFGKASRTRQRAWDVLTAQV